MKHQTTSKKLKYSGTEKFINVETGELEIMHVNSIEERDFNFTKVWMRNFITTLDIVGNQKTRLCFWIIDNLNKDNQLTETLRSIVEKTGISLETVRITLKILMDADFLRKIRHGLYIVNPDMVFKGTHNARLNILNQYTNAERIRMTDEERLESLMKSIYTLERQADSLRSKIASKQHDSHTQEETA